MKQIMMAWDWALQFNDEGLHIILLALGMIYIAVKKEEKKHRYLMLGYTAAFLLVYFCPPVVWFMDKILGDLVYWRMLWLLPMPVILAYSMVKIWAGIGNRWKKAGIFAAFILMLSLMGQNVYYQDSPYEKRANWEKLPTSPVAIVDIINQNRGSEDEWALLAAPADIVDYIVQYDASIRQVYGRKGMVRSYYIMNSIQSDQIIYKNFCKRLRRRKCNYVVLGNNTKKRVRGMEKRGFSVIGTVGSYNIYKDMRWTP